MEGEWIRGGGEPEGWDKAEDSSSKLKISKMLQ
jgi:hypothetical protein